MLVDVSELQIPTDELRAWNQGYDARLDSFPRERCNPYATPRLAIAWECGYRRRPIAAKQERTHG